MMNMQNKRSRNRNASAFEPDEFRVGETLRFISIDINYGTRGPETRVYHDAKVIGIGDDTLVISTTTYHQTRFALGAGPGGSPGYISQQRWFWKLGVSPGAVGIGVSPPPDAAVATVTRPLEYSHIRQVIFQSRAWAIKIRACIVMQRVFRGYKVRMGMFRRRHYTRRVREYFAEMGIPFPALMRRQTNGARELQRRYYAVKIFTAWRRFKYRKHSAARAVQRYIRGYLARKHIREAVPDEAPPDVSCNPQ